MIFGLMLDADEREEKEICRYLSRMTGLYTEEKLEIKTFRRSGSFLPELETTDLLDMALIDVTLPGALEGARLVRKRFAGTEILVIADISVSPMAYMHPSIRASALLLRPFAQEWETTVRDFFEDFLTKNSRDAKEQVLWVENRGGTFRIPFEQICYLEAREKKVFIRTKTEEFGMSGTIERLAEQLPENFMRCHRSFIVNENYISRIRLSENMLYLRDGLFVPVSRSYKGVFKRRSDE